MKLEDIGYNETFEKIRTAQKLNDFELGRIIAEHKERYTIKNNIGEYEAEITGTMRFSAKNREDFPAVGDWVAFHSYENCNAIIHKILPRFSEIKRQAVGRFGEVQLIATNIDFAFLIQAVDRDFNLNRLERYISLCYSAKVSPVIVLTKSDLIGERQLSELKKSISARINNIPVIAISNETQEGYETLKSIIGPGKTYCMLGSSGVGKSTLMNNLSGSSLMKTDAISTHTSKGRHTTSHRELIVLESGGILIDNPGMREVGIADSESGIESAFDQIIRLSRDCRYIDCTHTNEPGCSVVEAIEKGEIDHKSYENYLKMKRERTHFESSLEEKRKKDKEFGKTMKNYKKDLKKNTDY